MKNVLIISALILPVTIFSFLFVMSLVFPDRRIPEPLLYLGLALQSGLLARSIPLIKF